MRSCESQVENDVFIYEGLGIGGTFWNKVFYFFILEILY